MSPQPVRLTRAQVREVDRRAIEDYHVPGIVLMENAARGAADVASTMIPDNASVAILCGGGNNGGDGLAVARHLHNRGHAVHLLLTTDPAQYTGDALINWEIVRAMGLATAPFTPQALGQIAPTLLVDAVFGTGLIHPPRDPFPQLADSVNSAGVPVLAIDLPSGLDCDTGEPLGPACIRATRTVTFVAEKAGFANPAAGQYTGRITVAEIGCPRELIDKVLRDMS